MSRVYFSSVNKEVELWGAERALASCYIDKMALSILNIEQNYKDLYNILSPQHYLKNIQDPLEQKISYMEMAIRSHYGGGNLFILDGKPLNTWHMILNTAMVIGSNPIRFFCRLHAQCEIHAYIKGKNKKWLAQIIQEGLKSHIYREEAGWKEIINFLLEDNKNTVVMSYSVTDSFPSPSILEIYEDEAREKFYNKPIEKQWKKCLNVIYKNPFLEIKPDNLYLLFGDGITFFDLLNKIRT